MSRFKEFFDGDMHRYGSKGAKGYSRKFSYYFRKASTCQNKLLRIWYSLRFQAVSDKHGIEIPRDTRIGKGLYVGHPYNITINKKSILGENINIHKGVTIGQENRGARKGTPTIGNNVWIGINAVIVGNITIGDDVLIAPNAYVNCNVPAHSVVVGNPCKIIPRENATQDYIRNEV